MLEKGFVPIPGLPSYERRYRLVADTADGSGGHIIEFEQGSVTARDVGVTQL